MGINDGTADGFEVGVILGVVDGNNGATSASIAGTADGGQPCTRYAVYHARRLDVC